MAGRGRSDRNQPQVIVVGGGIGGLVTALSLHQCGFPVQVYEAVPEIKPLGVGINLLPHAVRELDALGLLPQLVEIAVTPQRLSYFSKHGKEIWSEPRGRAAGYQWPQISIHRGLLQRVLLEALVERLGASCINVGHKLTSVDSTGCDVAGVIARFQIPDGGEIEVEGEVLVAADGIHSTVRALAHPEEGMPLWNGALLWRGTVDHAPLLDGRTMVWAGHPDQKLVAYPIADLPDRRQRINFIAEYRTEERVLAQREDWNRRGDQADFVPRFRDWVFDWCDVPALLSAAHETYVFPMVDRDPLASWTMGRVTLLGDAAHPMYPIGSNGASQAILDARTLAGCLRAYGADVDSALRQYEELRLPATSAIVRANRSLGPELPMKLVEERAPDGFDDIDEVITRAEIDQATEKYRQTAGFAVASLASGISAMDAVLGPIS
jgi:2-polyprenyl-6-methoxyphenol hydroxylase-like FAD-dependent oxidoreductase